MAARNSQRKISRVPVSYLWDSNEEPPAKIVVNPIAKTMTPVCVIYAGNRAKVAACCLSTPAFIGLFFVPTDDPFIVSIAEGVFLAACLLPVAIFGREYFRARRARNKPTFIPGDHRVLERYNDHTEAGVWGSVQVGPDGKTVLARGEVHPLYAQTVKYRDDDGKIKLGHDWTIHPENTTGKESGAQPRSAPTEGGRLPISPAARNATPPIPSEGVFHPELFDDYNTAIETLEKNNYHQLTHYGSISILHDTYGIEVCGIHEKDVALAIAGLLQSKFPQFPHVSYHLKDSGREPGWRVEICLRPDEPRPN